jgi:hypothetical protein
MTMHLIPCPTVYETIIQPDDAKAIREASIARHANFRVSPAQNSHIQKMSEAMKNNQWVWTDAPPIRLSSDLQTCSDGLHRLTACVTSGVPLRTLVIVGDQWTAGVHTDRGKARTLAQYFAHIEIPNAALVASMAKAHVNRHVAHERKIGTRYAELVFATDEHYISFAADQHQNLTWVAPKAMLASARGLNGTGYGVVLLELAMADMSLAEELHCLMVDDDLDPLTGFAQLRQFAGRAMLKTGRRFPQHWTINNVVKAWNATYQGDAVRMWKPALWDDVRWPVGGAPENWKPV